MKASPVFIALAILFFVSCARGTPSDDIVYFASIEQADTKVFADENLMVLWHHDDRISIFEKYTYNKEFQFVGATGANAGAFEPVSNSSYVTGNDIPHVIAVYPFVGATSVNNSETISYHFPNEQSYSDNSFGKGDNVMVSFTDDNYLKFKNVGGYLSIKLYGSGVDVAAIRLKGNDGELLAGEAFIKASVSAPPEVILDGNNALPEIKLSCETPVSLNSSSDYYKEFWFVIPPVSFSKGFTVTVIDTDDNEYVKSTSKSILIERNKLSQMAPFEVHFDQSGMDSVDLGLSVKWATANLGASSPEEAGDYFAWGETAAKNEYTWSTYQWCNGTYSTLTKYCFTSSRGFNGFTDGKKSLDLDDDAARSVLGGSWRLPTDKEILELADSNNCEWTWTEVNHVKGYRVTSKINGKSIFLPASGRYYRTNGLEKVGTDGYYWSSELNGTNTTQGYCLHFNSDATSITHYGSERSSGHVIRAVMP